MLPPPAKRQSPLPRNDDFKWNIPNKDLITIFLSGKYKIETDSYRKVKVSILLENRHYKKSKCLQNGRFLNDMKKAQRDGHFTFNDIL